MYGHAIDGKVNVCDAIVFESWFDVAEKMRCILSFSAQSSHTDGHNYPVQHWMITSCDAFTLQLFLSVLAVALQPQLCLVPVKAERNDEPCWVAVSPKKLTPSKRHHAF